MRAAAIAICTGAQRPDILILDVGLPDIDGFEVCRTIRRVSDLPVLFLTSRTDEINRVVGLEIGGDDYLTKPFSPRELLARVKVVRRHLAALERRANGEPGTGESPNVVRHGPIELDRARSHDDRDLTPALAWRANDHGIRLSRDPVHHSSHVGQRAFAVRGGGKHSDDDPLNEDIHYGAHQKRGEQRERSVAASVLGFTHGRERGLESSVCEHQQQHCLQPLTGG